MLVQLPRLANSLREPFDFDNAYLQRKAALGSCSRNTPANPTAESELAQEIVKGLDSAPSEVRLAYRQFISSIITLVDGETTSEEFKETALTIYFSLGRSTGSENEKGEEFAERRSGIQKILGRAISHESLRTAGSAAHKLFISQSGNSEILTTRENCSHEESEFGADLIFKEPVRFAEDLFSENGEKPGISIASDAIRRDIITTASAHLSSDRTFDLRWLKDVCEQIVVRNASHFSSDELAMAICQLLDSERHGEEIAGDVLDLAGEGEFETVQQLIFHRKELVGAIHSSMHTLKSDKTAANPQNKMPSYATQVTVHRESERQMDRLRRKEEKRSKHGSEMAAEATSFSSLLQASEKKSPIENLIGQGGDGDSLRVTALPQGTVRKHHKGYEEVIIPPTPSAAVIRDEELIYIKDLDDFAQAAFQGYTSLNRIQSRIFQSTYHTNENILVCAPTGSGKTNIAMLAVLHEISQHFEDDAVGGGRCLRKNEFKVVYVAPMKALAAEVTSTFSRRLLPLNVSVRELTGDMQLSKKELEETQMIVTTPEKWDVMTRKSNDMSLSMSVKLLIIDEVHLLNDDRGAVIEALVARTLRQVESTQTMIRIVGLSATLPNHREVAQFLRVNPDAGLFFFDSSYRPVPLAQRYIGITEPGFAARMELLNDICYGRVAGSLRHGNQAMVFVHSRKDTAKTAQRLIELSRSNADGDLFRSDAHPRYSLARKEVAAKSKSRELAEYFDAAVGIHHAGMPRSDRSLVERLFSDGILKVLVCTATLAWGVNLPAHTVVIKGTQLYDAKAGGWRDLGMLDVMQIFGRAGRPQFDTSGEGIIITSHAKLAYYLRMLTSQLPIESRFVGSLKDNLNAEVVLGTVTNVKEACAWLGYTYLFIRMRVNPLSYGVSWDEVVADPSLASKQRSLVVDAARALDRARMARFDEKSGNLYCTELGRIASHYYIQYSSVETYNEILRRNMSDGDVIEMIARSSEFENIAVRDEEQDELEAAAGNRFSCPLDVKGGPTSRHGKVSILIQLYISRASLSSFSLVSDAAYVSASLGRITRALFEICLRRGWSEMSGFLLNYCKAVDRRVWPHQHPLRQLDISPEIARKLEERDADVDRLGEMSDADVGALIRYGPGGKVVKQCLSFFPKLELSATVSPITRTVLKVDLAIAPVFVWKDRFHGTSQCWWIFVEDSENDHVYHSELFVLSKRTWREPPSKLSFVVPIFEPHPAQYYVRAVSDSWLNSESVLDVSFRNLPLPSARHSHTELLDLRPLPLAVLRDEPYESVYGFSHFNPIQTQCFHALYHTDDNVLLGAPTGSGKTVSAELAMFRLFDAHPGMKAVYVAPLKAIVRERAGDWKRRLVGRLGKRMVEVTGDHTPDSAALSSADVIITTPEKWDGISRGWRHGRSYVTRVGLVILDEIHLLGADRGAILEAIVSRMRYISSRTERPIRFVGLSTALANAGDLAGWLGVPDSGLFNFKPSVRPVPLEVHIQGYPGKFYCPRMNSMNKPTYAAISAHSPSKPVLVFVSSRRQTRLTALDLVQFAASDDRPRRFLSIPDDDLEMVISQVSDQNLRHTLRFGIGIHHAGLTDRDRSLAEELFSNGKIQVLVSTATLAWGVNLPCHLVVVKGTEYYDGKAKRYADFPITDILQMMGRAGRPQYDRHGKAVILVHEPKKSFYKKFLYEPFPVESSLRGHLHDHFNAEIVSGVVRTREDAANYLTWTYLYFRITANPAYYGLESADPDAVRRYLSGLVEETFRDLEDSECVRYDGDRVEPIALGHVASRYYLSYATVSMFGSNVSPDATPDLLLLILSGASEYDDLPVRHNEENYNALLADKARYPVDPARLDDPHVKANLLFQSHFSRLELPVSDYVTDLKSVLDQSVRIVQAMVDVSANSGWLSTALSCMRLLQMLMQGLWLADDLWMLPMMTHDVCRVLHGKGLSRVSGLLELSEPDLQSAVGETVAGSRLYQDLRHYPRIRAQLSVREHDGGTFSLHVRLESIGRKNRGSSKAHLPRFSKNKDEGWWLVLTRTSSSVEELCALRRVSFSDRNVVTASLDLPGPSVMGMNLILVSDCYIGFEQVHPLPQQQAC